MPPIASPSRPASLAKATLRARFTGRSRAKAMLTPTAISARNTNITAVMRQSSQSSTTSAAVVVMRLPTNWTRPDPSTLRMPSGSDRMREVSAPVCTDSKYDVGRRSMCAARRRRQSLTTRCAVTPNHWATAKPAAACTATLAITMSASGTSRSLRRSTSTWSMNQREEAGNTRPASRPTSVRAIPPATTPRYWRSSVVVSRHAIRAAGDAPRVPVRPPAAVVRSTSSSTRKSRSPRGSVLKGEDITSKMADSA